MNNVYMIVKWTEYKGVGKEKSSALCNKSMVGKGPFTDISHITYFSKFTKIYKYTGIN